MGNLNGALLPGLLLCLLLAVPAQAQLPTISALVYKDNAEFVKYQMLPEEWRMWAVMKWEAYGHGIANLAPAAATAADGIAVLYNYEAETAVSAALQHDVEAPRLLRIMPANYSDVVEAIQAGWNMSELVGPSNLADVARAAADTGATIPIHLYLFMHYADAWGWNFTTSEELQDLVDSLPPGLALEGIMMHSNGYPEEEKPKVLSTFFKVVCPLAERLDEAGERLVVHWADSMEVLRLIPEDGSTLRMAMPADACQSKDNSRNIDYWARIGFLSYGTDRKLNADLQHGTEPVMNWEAKVAKVSRKGNRSVATVELAAPGRYPSPGWWQNVEAYQNTSLVAGQPPATVVIAKQTFRLAAVPSGDGTRLEVDVSHAKPRVKAGDPVCLLCSAHTLQDMSQETGADDYNVALAVAGHKPVEGTEYEEPALVSR